VAEFGADFVKSQLLVTNVTPAIDEIMKSGFNNSADDFDQGAGYQLKPGHLGSYRATKLNPI
jgi:hypothetical protein